MTDTNDTPIHKPQRGSARAALGVRDFRLVWFGSLGSNIGTWMQNVVLPAYVYHRTGKASVVGLLIFAQLGPLLFLSIPAGVIADRFNRKKWLVSMQVVQLSFSLALATLALGTPPIWALFAAAFGVGIGNALNAPAWSAMLPSLVDPQHLSGAIALNSTVINGSRVVGPIIVAVFSQWGATTAQFFYFNAATYLLVIFALLNVDIPSFVPDPTQGWRRFTVGLSIARDRPVVRRLIVSLAIFSMFSLPYVGLFPAVARLTFKIDESGPTYKWLYATWGLGACLGGLAVGTVFSHVDMRRLIQWGFAGFSLTMFFFALSQSPLPAFISGFFLGFAYFFTTTSMMTVVQMRLEPEVRGRVLALWFMAFGGLIPFGNMFFGPLIDRYGSRGMLLISSATALFLAWRCNITALDKKHPALSGQHLAN
jgi:MFS family permease